MKVIDDALPLSLSNHLHKLCCEKCKWDFISDTSQPYADGKKSPGFGCSILSTGVKGNDFDEKLYYRFESSLIILSEVAGLDILDLIRIRLGLYFPIEIPDDHNRPHVDQDYPHTVLLYYINDSDGDTYFFKKKKIIDRVTPKQNRLVIFDGTTHHASSNPSKGHRISLNLNYKI